MLKFNVKYPQTIILSDQYIPNNGPGNWTFLASFNTGTPKSITFVKFPITQNELAKILEFMQTTQIEGIYSAKI